MLELIVWAQCKSNDMSLENSCEKIHQIIPQILLHISCDSLTVFMQRICIICHMYSISFEDFILKCKTKPSASACYANMSVVFFLFLWEHWYLSFEEVLMFRTFQHTKIKMKRTKHFVKRKKKKKAAAKANCSTAGHVLTTPLTI